MKQRITISEVLENDWFKKGYQAPIFEQEDVSLDDVNAIFSESTVSILEPGHLYSKDLSDQCTIDFLFLPFFLN